MKGVFGVALLLIGFTTGYLVLAGRLPSSQPVVSSTSTPAVLPSSSSSASLPTAGKPFVDISQQPVSPGNIGSGGPTGLPTMQHLQDVNASLGGMQ